MTHPSHDTYISDSSHYDEVCKRCRRTDESGLLDAPCPVPAEPSPIAAAADVRESWPSDPPEGEPIVSDSPAWDRLPPAVRSETRRPLTPAYECTRLDAMLAGIRVFTTHEPSPLAGEVAARSAVGGGAAPGEATADRADDAPTPDAAVAAASFIGSLQDMAAFCDECGSSTGIGPRPLAAVAAKLRDAAFVVEQQVKLRDSLRAEIARLHAEINLAMSLAGLPYVSRAVVGVLAERRRQIEVEGYTPAHDDAHDKGELAGAAAAYAAYRSQAASEIIMGDEIIASLWPWPGEGSYKPKGRHRDLERACTLLIAEIERLDRLDDRLAASEA